MVLQSMRVLIVEDDPLVAMEAETMVAELGGVVAGTARSVLAATEMAQKCVFDCVLLDVNLRGEMALGLAGELKRRGIPFVFCTAYARAFEGFEQVPHVTKPYSSDRLASGFCEAFPAAIAHAGSLGPPPASRPLITANHRKCGAV